MPEHRPSTEQYARLERATETLQAPFALLDLDAMWANAVDLERRASRKPIRLASKSLRCRALQQRVLARTGFVGTLAFTLPEALWLASHGVEDILVAYPTADLSALATLAEMPERRVSVMVDCTEQLELVERAIGDSASGPVSVCIDLDAGWRALGGRLRVGAKRSPVHTPEHAATLCGSSGSWPMSRRSPASATLPLLAPCAPWRSGPCRRSRRAS
jgi:D-serine deaminase-like pyridoxal phosphate-dependent protein